MKKILSEATVRRFQALANIPGLRESHGRGQHEGGDYVSGREELDEKKEKDEEDDELDEGMYGEEELDESMTEEDEGMGSLYEAEDETIPDQESKEEEEKALTKAGQGTVDAMKKYGKISAAHKKAPQTQKESISETMKKLKTLLEQAEEAEEEGEDVGEMGDMGAGADLGAGAGEGGMDKNKVEDALEKALKAMADSLASDLNLSIDVVGGEEAAATGGEIGRAHV